MNDEIHQDALLTSSSQEFEINRLKTKKSLPALLIVFTLATLMIQCFNLVYANIGESMHMSANTSALLSTVPGIILGVVCMLYDTLCDYISPKKMTLWGVSALVLGSLLGFFASTNFWLVLVARMIQVAGGQVTGSVFLVMTVKYLTNREKAIYIGVFNAVYYLAAALGVFAGGWITNIPWKFLFLIPTFSLFVVPWIIRDTPDISIKGSKIDVIGIVIFAIFALLIAIVFSYPSWGLVIAIVLVGVMFATYVAKGKNPFITSKLVKNSAFMGVWLLLVLFYLFNYATTPIYQVIGDNDHISLLVVSWCLTAVNLVSAIVGIFSGPIVHQLGRYGTMVWSGIAMVIGFVASALFIHASFWLLTVMACIFMAGITAVYTPIYDAAAAAVPESENGRAIGICDLTLNVTSSIGMAMYNACLANPQFLKHGLFGISGVAVGSSNMFWVMAAFSLVALILTFIFRKAIVKK